MTNMKIPLQICPYEENILENATCGSEWKHVRGCSVHDRCTRGPNKSKDGEITSCWECSDHPVKGGYKALILTKVSSVAMASLPAPVATDCCFRGRATGLTKGLTATKKTRIPLFTCRIHGSCATDYPTDNKIHWCKICPQKRTTGQLTQVLFDFPHGLGDCVQFAVVLRHLAAAYQDWVIDVRTHPAKMAVFRHVANKILSLHDKDVDLTPYKSISRPSFADQPTMTKTLSCLKAYKLAVKPDLMQYKIELRLDDLAAAYAFYRLNNLDPAKTIIVHHKGHSLKSRKNLTDKQITPLVEKAHERGLSLVILDFDYLLDPELRTHPAVIPLVDPFYMDAGKVAALKTMARSWVGIDSGPGHVGGAVNKPGVMVWTGNHPLRYYDAGMNHVLHLVPPHLKLLSPQDHTELIGYRTASYLHLAQELPKHVLGD